MECHAIKIDKRTCTEIFMMVTNLGTTSTEDATSNLKSCYFMVGFLRFVGFGVGEDE